MNIQSARKLKGFTLIEMVVAMGIFSIMVVAVGGAFSSGFLTYSNARELQRNVESAQYTINTLGKELRTSTIVNPSTSGKKRLIRFYDHSSLRCFEYWIDTTAHDFKAKWKDIPDTSADPLGECAVDTGFGTDTSLAGYIDGLFTVFPSDVSSSPKKMGRVTIQLIVGQKQAAKFKSHLQTSVSLLDYDYVGF